MTVRLVTQKQPPLKPPRKLGPSGSVLWQSVMHEYGISDCGGLEMLLLICEALDRAVMLREEIVRDGPTIRTKTGQIKEHPCLKHELSAMAYVSRGLQRLGLNFEAIQPIGRPTSYHGVKNAD